MDSCNKIPTGSLLKTVQEKKYATQALLAILKHISNLNISNCNPAAIKIIVHYQYLLVGSILKMYYKTSVNKGINNKIVFEMESNIHSCLVFFNL